MTTTKYSDTQSQSSKSIIESSNENTQDLLKKNNKKQKQAKAKKAKSLKIEKDKIDEDEIIKKDEITKQPEVTKEPVIENQEPITYFGMLMGACTGLYNGIASASKNTYKYISDNTESFIYSVQETYNDAVCQLWGIPTRHIKNIGNVSKFINYKQATHAKYGYKITKEIWDSHGFWSIYNSYNYLSRFKISIEDIINNSEYKEDDAIKLLLNEINSITKDIQEKTSNVSDSTSNSKLLKQYGDIFGDDIIKILSTYDNMTNIIDTTGYDHVGSKKIFLSTKTLDGSVSFNSKKYINHLNDIIMKHLSTVKMSMPTSEDGLHIALSHDYQGLVCSSMNEAKAVPDELLVPYATREQFEVAILIRKYMISYFINKYLKCEKNIQKTNDININQEKMRFVVSTILYSLHNSFYPDESEMNNEFNIEYLQFKKDSQKN